MERLFNLFDQYPAIPIGMMVALVVAALLRRMRQRDTQPTGHSSAGHPRAQPASQRQAKVVGWLDVPLFHWPDGSPFRRRDLLNSLLILGRTGSGKTSSSGRTLMQAIVNDRKSGGLILAAKPEDVEDIRKIFRKAGRLNDLIEFDAQGPYRFNFLDYVGKGEARNVVRCMMMISETLQRGEKGGGGDDEYWRSQCERLIETAVILLKLAGEPVTAINLHRFLMTAAEDTKTVLDPNWQGNYQGKVLEKGFEAEKTSQEAHDFEMAKDYWVIEYPGLADRTRSSILNYATQILYAFNTGMAKEMIAGETNCSPDDILDGLWIVVNFPSSNFGVVGALINSGWKYTAELAILKRKATEKSPFVTIWCDEAHQTVNSYDATFIAQCRSHKGCLVYLTQSISSFYAAMKGQSGHHQADALCANFTHTIIHASDPVTAHWASSKLGKRKEVFYSGSSSPSHNASVYDQVYGQQQVSVSYSTHYEAYLQDEEFMTGRTGGPDNNYLVDSIVIRSGEPFADGNAYQRVTWSQKG